MGEALFFEGARLFVISLGMEKPVGDVGQVVQPIPQIGVGLTV